MRHPARTATARRRLGGLVTTARERAGDRGPGHGDEARPRMGFFTDTSVCIGCKACEVACKEWNQVPEDGLDWTGGSYDNTVAARRRTGGVTCRSSSSASRSGATARRSDAGEGATSVPLADVLGRLQALHARGVPRRLARPARSSAPSSARSSSRRTSATVRLLRAGVPVRRARQAGAAAQDRTRRPTAALGRRKTGGSSSARFVTTGRGRQEPACAKACPTDSIQFGELEDLRDRSRGDRETRRGRAGPGAPVRARSGRRRRGAGAFFCCWTSRRSTGCRGPRRAHEHLPPLARRARRAARCWGGRGGCRSR